MKDGFIKIAAGVPEIALGDCSLNAERIVSMARDMNTAGVKLAVFTELGITGYTLEDLFLQQTLLHGAEKALEKIIEQTSEPRITNATQAHAIRVLITICLFSILVGLAGAIHFSSVSSR